MYKSLCTCARVCLCVYACMCDQIIGQASPTQVNIGEFISVWPGNELTSSWIWQSFSIAQCNPIYIKY